MLALIRNALLALHVASGAVAALAFLWLAVARKGDARHRALGRWYLWAAVASSLTTYPLLYILLETPILSPPPSAFRIERFHFDVIPATLVLMCMAGAWVAQRRSQRLPAPGFGAELAWNLVVLAACAAWTTRLRTGFIPHAAAVQIFGQLLVLGASAAAAWPAGARGARRTWTFAHSLSALTGGLLLWRAVLVSGGASRLLFRDRSPEETKFAWLAFEAAALLAQATLIARHFTAKAKTPGT